MATMDTIKLYGGEPANFLDVGDGATAEKVTEAFKIMLKNPKVKGILVNIFGGIMQCYTITRGVVAAARAVNLSVPLVVRMKCTNDELGQQTLNDSGLPIVSADQLAAAAHKIFASLPVRSARMPIYCPLKHNHVLLPQVHPRSTTQIHPPSLHDALPFFRSHPIA